jgi:putative endonuclease
MTRERLDLGKWGEDLALKKVKKLGYRCLARNYRCPLGEVDLIAKDGDTLVFVEIKTRRGRSLEYAKEAVNRHKRRQLSRVALAYMKEKGFADMRARFDVVVINLNKGSEEIEVVRNAFDLAYP